MHRFVSLGWAGLEVMEATHAMISWALRTTPPTGHGLVLFAVGFGQRLQCGGQAGVC